MKESVVEAYLVRRLKEAGHGTRKLKWIGRCSAPDRVVMVKSRRMLEGLDCAWCNPQGRTIWVELKRPAKGAEKAQAREHNRMREFGQEVVVLNTIEAVDSFIEGL